MEDVLEVYHRQYGDNEVLVCLDETSKQQVKETRRPRPARPGAACIYDYEYERNGMSNLFMLFAPLEGWRRVEVTDRRTRADWARVVRQLVDEDYADKDRIVLVMDNLNIHHPASLYEAFEPAEARRIAERLEIHYTPKHGSWLDMAEIEIGVLARQCLNRHIPDRGVLRREAAAWQQQRNRDTIQVDWRFTTKDARIKLKSLTHQYNTDGLLDSDRWVVPLAIAINSENPMIGPETMEKIAARDPGMAGLVLNEVKNNWSMEEPAESLPPGTAIQIGTSIRNAMNNWKEGLGSLMLPLGMLDQTANIRTLGVDVRPGRVTTSWYRGDAILDPVVQLPEDLHDRSKEHLWNWPSWTSRGIEPTRVWPWSITHRDLSGLLSKELRSFRLALDSTEGFHELACDFANALQRSYFYAKDLQSSTDVIDYIDEWLLKLNGDPGRSVTFGHTRYHFTGPELELFKERLSDLCGNGIDFLQDPWPTPDKEWPPGRSGGMSFEIYTEERLVERTNAVFNGALRIYNHIVERWLPAFTKRNQMRYTPPFRMRGVLRLLEASSPNKWNEAVLTYWNEWADDTADSGVFIEMGPKERTTDDDTRKRIQAAQEKFIEQGKPYYSGWEVLHGYEPKPATTLAHKWLTSDLNALHWSK